MFISEKVVGLPMTEEIYNNKNLNDTIIIEYLETKLHNYVRNLDLANNHLTRVPELTYFRYLDSLKRLQMHGNRIDTFVWGDIPSNTEYLSFSSNMLSRLPNVGEHDGCLTIKTLDLYDNNLQSITRNQMPESVQLFDISYNQVAVISGNVNCLDQPFSERHHTISRRSLGHLHRIKRIPPDFFRYYGRATCQW